MGFKLVSTELEAQGFIALGKDIRDNKLNIITGDLDTIKKYLDEVKKEIFDIIKFKGGVTQISDLHPYVYFLVAYGESLDDEILDRVKKPLKRMKEKYEKSGKDWWYYPAVKTFFETH